MANLILPPSWQAPERAVTDEAEWLSRRELLRRLGLGLGAMAVSGLDWKARAGGRVPLRRLDARASFEPGRPLTSEEAATRHVNYYELSVEKRRAVELAQALVTQPWEVEVAGLCERPGRYDYTDLIDFRQLEERRYRFRCVEAWSMTVPWIGVPLRSVIDGARPTAAATHVRFVSVLRPEQMPAQARQTWHPWPYVEGLRLDEARHDLTLLAVGMYGKELPPQNGAPLRVVVPWKYGYKSAKAIVRIELVDRQPQTFWNRVQPDEYGFLANVDPAVPHPRWSQAEERLIDSGVKVPTLPYNGYGEHVADLYGPS